MCVLCPPVVWSLPFLHLFAIFFSLALAMTKNKRRIIITISARPDYYYLDSYRTDYEYRDYIPTKKKKKSQKVVCFTCGGIRVEAYFAARWTPSISIGMSGSK